MDARMKIFYHRNSTLTIAMIFIGIPADESISNHAEGDISSRTLVCPSLLLRHLWLVSIDDKFVEEC